MKKNLKHFLKLILTVLRGISTVIGWLLKPLIFILSIFSHTSSVSSQVHMNTQRDIEMKAQFKYDDIKEKLTHDQHTH